VVVGKQQKGIRSELLAAIDFLDKPFNHVYYDLGGKGPCDLIVVDAKKGTVDLYDVKTHSERVYKGKMRRINRTKNKSAKNLDVKILYVKQVSEIPIQCSVE
jgi:Holliday junction resolvase-like predicted endonuclease|tara:strand:+ start:1788 stop:2093 length:306 start_codon:yes stop_codon:yes gene_type:complete